MITRRTFIRYSGLIAGIAALKSLELSANVQAAYAADSDDTELLQEEINRGGHVTLQNGRIYRVSGPPRARAALVIGSDTFLDLDGATLQLAPNQSCSLIAERASGRTRNVRIANGRIIGSGSLQPRYFRRDIGFVPTIYLSGCDNIELRDLEMRDTYMYAIYAHGDGGVLANINIDGAIGGGIHLDGANWRIGDVQVRNVTYFEKVNCQGNPFIVCLRDSEIGRIYCENYGYGIKFQDGCENLTVASVQAIGGPNNFESPDFLVKIQGKLDKEVQRRNRNIRIGSISSRNGPLSGLYIYYSSGVQIGSYDGENNGASRPPDFKNGSDILIIDSDNIYFDRLRAINFHRFGLWLHDRTGHVAANSVEIKGGIAGEGDPVVVRSGLAVLGGKKYGNSAFKSGPLTPPSGLKVSE
jgi:hypothetical protein